MPSLSTAASLKVLVRDESLSWQKEDAAVIDPEDKWLESSRSCAGAEDCGRHEMCCRFKLCLSWVSEKAEMVSALFR